MPRVSDMKERLTDAAVDLIWHNSYGTTSVDAICERAGAKKGSFYYFFKSKSELAAAALEADWNKKRAEMDSIFSATVPPLERLDRYFDFVHDRLAELQKKCGSILGCPLLSIGSEVSTQDQIVREAIDRIMDRKMNYFISAVRDAQAQGLIARPIRSRRRKRCSRVIKGQWHRRGFKMTSNCSANSNTWPGMFWA